MASKFLNRIGSALGKAASVAKSVVQNPAIAAVGNLVAPGAYNVLSGAVGAAARLAPAPVVKAITGMASATQSAISRPAPVSPHVPSPASAGPGSIRTAPRGAAFGPAYAETTRKFRRA